jgi:hypothetical protein
MAYTAFNNIKYIIKKGIINNNNSDILLNLTKLKRYNDNLSEISIYKENMTTGILKINIHNNKEIFLNKNRP